MPTRFLAACNHSSLLQMGQWLDETMVEFRGAGMWSIQNWGELKGEGFADF